MAESQIAVGVGVFIKKHGANDEAYKELIGATDLSGLEEVREKLRATKLNDTRQHGQKGMKEDTDFTLTGQLTKQADEGYAEAQEISDGDEKGVLEVRLSESGEKYTMDVHIYGVSMDVSTSQQLPFTMRLALESDIVKTAYTPPASE